MLLKTTAPGMMGKVEETGWGCCDNSSGPGLPHETETGNHLGDHYLAMMEKKQENMAEGDPVHTTMPVFAPKTLVSGRPAWLLS